MPPLTRYFVKTCLVWLVLGLLLMILHAFQGVFGGIPLFATLRPVYWHLITVGGIVQMIFGVAFWMFPKYTKENPRRSDSVGWAVYWLLNVGLFLRLISEPMVNMSFAEFWGILLAVSALLQWLSALGFIMNTWGRVKAR